MVPRVERHHRIVDELRAAAPRTVTELAATLGVSARSIERAVELTPGEAAVLVASLAGIGPLASATAQSALDKLVRALAG